MTKIALTLLLSSSIGIIAYSQPETGIAWKEFTFKTPTAGVVRAERAWVEVPERHSRPDGPKIRLNIVKLPSTGTKAGWPIIWLAGGPGNSGSRTPASRLYPVFEALRAYGDVIAFDQRGTGSSEPSLMVPGRFDLPSDKHIDSPEAMRRLTAVGYLIRDTIRGRGIDLAAYNTIESADDVNALRRALGVEKVVLWAHSYGTHLALAVLKRHGAHIERAILGGVNGLDDRWREPAQGDRLLARVASKIRDDATLAEVVPDFVGQVKRVLAQLDRNPIRIERDNATVLIGKPEIQTLVAIRSGGIDFIRNLPWLFASLEKGTELEEVATAVQRVIRNRPIGTAMTYAMHVASGVSPERKTRIESQIPEAVLGNAINWGIGESAFAKALSVPDLGQEFRKPFRSNVPVLLISATLDGRTAEADARTVRKQFRRASYVTLDGASHEFFWDAPPKLLDMIVAFLRNERISDVQIAVPIEFRRPDPHSLKR